MSIKTSPQRAPDYALYREDIAAVDTVANFKKTHGCNSSMYKNAHIQVIPAGGANPNVTIYWWSDEADAFIQEHTAITKAGVGADTPFEFTIQPMGRIFFVAVTTLATGTVSIAVSGFEQEQFS